MLSEYEPLNVVFASEKEHCNSILGSEKSCLLWKKGIGPLILQSNVQASPPGHVFWGCLGRRAILAPPRDPSFLQPSFLFR
jgi:hypothetical protein